MQKLEELAYPGKGIRFSPYGHIDLDKDQVFRGEEISNLWSNDTRYVWGVQEGSGEPIVLSFAEYYARYVWDYDFRKAPEVKWNEVTERGTLINNTDDAYPDAEWVEMHFPGFDPQYGGMDWRSLRLMYEQDGCTWRLVGIAHDECTP